MGAASSQSEWSNDPKDSRRPRLLAFVWRYKGCESAAPDPSFLARGPRPHAFRLSGLVFAAQAAPSNVFILSSFHVIIFFLQLIPPVTFLASLSKSNAKCRMMARFSAAYPVLTRE